MGFADKLKEKLTGNKNKAASSNTRPEVQRLAAHMRDTGTSNVAPTSSTPESQHS